MRTQGSVEQGYRSRWLWIFLLFFNFLLPIVPALAVDAGEVVSILGSVSVMREGRWQPAKIGDVLAVGDTIKTGEGSRLALQLTRGAQLKINANSELVLKHIEPQDGLAPSSLSLTGHILRLLRGEIWIQSHDEPLEVQTVPVIATIRGTQFNLVVNPDDMARLAVLDGVVEFKNPQGRVLVAANEQATAKLGEPPRKTVLLNPLDAVQWSLYYPGFVSYRDYPLFDDLAAQPAETDPSLQAVLTQAEAHFNQGAHQAAHRAFTQALQKEPDNARALTGLGWVLLEAGEAATALDAFRSTQGATLMRQVGMAHALYQLNRFAEADPVIAKAKADFPYSPLPWIQTALTALIQGRVASAQQALDEALQRDPQQALAHALRSNIELVQNRKAAALEAAHRAIAANPSSPTAYLALSLVKQAEFQLKDALEAAGQAVQLDPENPQALVQQSRLLFGMGRIKEAAKRVEKARKRAPHDATVSSTRGFLYLARGRVQEAEQAFKDAIAQDSTLGEPHLGLGLALFRQNQKDAALGELHKATLLDPQVSLYNSYLGKAYYEIRDGHAAKKYLADAKQLDPRDPTPYFYDAIRLQSDNRPAEAVNDLQAAIALNDNRAVYRSNLLLDEDIAARGARLGYLYRTLGLEKPALLEGWQSLDSDQTNYSAHRLLADAYSGLPQHEMARDSELLQAQLLQPINMTPVQPRLSSDGMAFLNDVGPYGLGFNEYTRLLRSNGFQVHTDVVGGGNGILVDNVIVSGLHDNLSYSVGHFHSETEVYRANADVSLNIFNAFFQTALSPNLSVLTEFRKTQLESGYRFYWFFDQENFSPSYRDNYDLWSGRLSVRYSPNQYNTFLGTYIHSDQAETYGSKPNQRYFNDVVDQFELRHISQFDTLSITSGLGYLSGKTEFRPNADEPPSYFDISHLNTYFYGTYHFPKALTVTLGLSTDSYKDEVDNYKKRVNPKFGFIWKPTDTTTIRGAAFQSLKRPVISSQTIEPTQIAGFNQFFDGYNGEVQRVYGLAIDQTLNSDAYIGAEIRRQDAVISFPGAIDVDVWNQIGRVYVYKILSPRWVFGGQYQYEKSSSNEPDSDAPVAGFREQTLQKIPLELRYFHPSGFFAWGRASYVNQKGDFSVPQNDHYQFKTDADDFVLVDGAVGYWLSKRSFLLSLEVRNLLDQKFNLQEPGLGRLDFTARERLILARFSYDF